MTTDASGFALVAREEKARYAYIKSMPKDRVINLLRTHRTWENAMRCSVCRLVAELRDVKRQEVEGGD